MASKENKLFSNAETSIYFPITDLKTNEFNIIDDTATVDLLINDSNNINSLSISIDEGRLKNVHH